MNTNYVISLEIGSSATKIGAASFASDLGSDTPVTVIAIEEEPLTNCVRYGRIQNVEDVTRHTMLALDRLSGRTGLYPRKITGVYTAIGGRSLASCKATASLDFGDETEITNDVISRLKKEAMLQVPEGRIALEVIPLKYIIDEIATSRPVGSFGKRIKADFTLVFCDPLNERNLERVIVERLDLDICGYVVRPLAIANLTLTAEDTKPGCMLVDLGAETTTVAIYKDGSLQYLATIPLGSHNITRDLANGMSVIEEQAEKIKIRLGNAISDSTSLTEEQRTIDNFVQARVSEIIANILAHIKFAGYKSSEICSGIIITGRGAKLRNFCQLLRIQSNLPVRVASAPSHSILVSDPAINPTDNIDLIALAHEAMLRCQNGNTVPCVTPYEPEPEKPAEPVQTAKPAQTAAAPVQQPTQQPSQPAQPAQQHHAPEEPAQPISSIYDYTGGVFGNTPANDDEPESQPATDETNVSEEYLLVDSDEEERRKQRQAEKAKEEREKAIAAEEKRRKKEQKRLSRPGLYDRIKSRIKDLIDDSGEGNDLEDEELE